MIVLYSVPNGMHYVQSRFNGKLLSMTTDREFVVAVSLYTTKYIVARIYGLSNKVGIYSTF